MTIDEYVSSGTYITEKMKQDSYVADQIVAEFVPSQHRAIMKDLEVKILKEGPTGQTANDTNSINGAYHRFVGGGTGQTMVPEDFAKIAYALDLANVPLTNLIGIVHPSVAYHLSTLTNLVNVSNNPAWEGIVRTGMVSGMRFVMNIYGIDIYTSQNVHVNTASETVDSLTVSAGVNNVFFSATPGIMPIIGAIRQPVKVESFKEVDYQREKYVTTMRYGLGFHRPENFVTVLTDTDQVYS